jgi:hypothetical protein
LLRKSPCLQKSNLQTTEKEAPAKTLLRTRKILHPLLNMLWILLQSPKPCLLRKKLLQTSEPNPSGASYRRKPKKRARKKGSAHTTNFSLASLIWVGQTFLQSQVSS